MLMGELRYFDNFSPVGDLIVVAICFVIMILLITSYVRKTKAYYIFLNIVAFLIAAALCDVIHHDLYTQITNGDYTSVYIFRLLYRAFLFSILFLFVVYIVTLQRLELDKKIPVMIVSSLIYVSAVIVDIVTCINGTGFHLNRDGTAVNGFSVFLYGYLGLVMVSIFLMLVFRKRLHKRVMLGFYGTITISFLILYIQKTHGQSSFTASTFLFPIIAMLYLIHVNPVNIELGSISIRALEDMVNYNFKHGHKLLFMSLYLPGFDVEGRTLPKELQDSIRRNSSQFFSDAVLFQVSYGHVVLVNRIDGNSNYSEKLKALLNAFEKEHQKYQNDYKIVIGASSDDVSRENEYVSIIKSIHRYMQLNEVHMVVQEDLTKYKEYKAILAALNSISHRHDPNDPRVQVYCQPVYNIMTKTYDTAEVLMRLDLPDIGLVYPDKFISIAEESGLINILTKIILHKTCTEIRKLTSEGYLFDRISVNISIVDLRQESFTSDIDWIIHTSGISSDKLALEITESQNEEEFKVIKSRINELKGRGITFYLDDFGTGYSNLERIMELPFDIIKFDRSLVNASSNDERSQMMVRSMANLFSQLQYAVLYEGIETDNDESRCINMSARYLQGYKYSHPVPITELRKFFSRKE